MTEATESTLETGDFIAFRHPDIPLPEIQAVVIADRGSEIEVMSTLIAPFRHSGVFDRERMKGPMVVRPAAEAIPLESHRDWQQFQRLDCVHGEGRLIAAFDGVCVTRRDDGELITAGANHLIEVKQENAE